MAVRSPALSEVKPVSSPSPSTIIIKNQ